METGQADQFLIDEIRQGGEDAWRQLVARYQGRLFAYARSRLARPTDAEDAVQEAFVGFVQSLPHYDPSRSLETYLFAILRYKINDLYKRHGLMPTTSFGAAIEAYDALMIPPAPGHTPSGALRRDEARAEQERLMAAILRKLIGELRDRGKFDDLRIVELSFFVGMRNKDIAKLLDVGEKHVAGVKFRAIRRLQSFVAETRSGEPPDDDSAESLTEATVAIVWRRARVSCLKRSTLGAHLLGVLDEPWNSYAQFHLEVVGCSICVANLEDLKAESTGPVSSALRERILASSIGFVSRANG